MKEKLIPIFETTGRICLFLSVGMLTSTYIHICWINQIPQIKSESVLPFLEVIGNQPLNYITATNNAMVTVFVICIILMIIFYASLYSKNLFKYLQDKQENTEVIK